jgi:glutathione S-transferase
MALALYYHPLSSYSWKVLVPLYDAAPPIVLWSLEDAQASAEWKRRWPIEKFPVLVDDVSGLTLPEASIIIEYLDEHFSGPHRLLPVDAADRLEVRLLDRFFDNYLHTPMQKIVGDALRDASRRDAQGVEEARAMIARSYAWLEGRLGSREWAAGAHFTLADCAAMPALFYADWVHPMGDNFPKVAAYRQRLLARPSAKRVVDDARPYRKYFPLGAPDRD